MAIKSNAGDQMLPDHHGISSGYPEQGPPRPQEYPHALFLGDHQLPAAEAPQVTEKSFLDPELLKRKRDRGEA